MKRLREFVRGVVLGIALLLIVMIGSASCARAGLPNIVILYADDMGYGDLGVQNPESKVPTPRLDRLASEGMRLTDAHSSSGICTPSRYALLTGRYHWRKFHSIVGPFGGSRFDPERVTLPELLKTRGYRTACIGKWHLGWDWEANRRPDARPKKTSMGYPHYAPDAFDWEKPIADGPLAHGFDYYFGDDVPNFPPYTWFENDRLLQAPTVETDPQRGNGEARIDTRIGPGVVGWRLDAVLPRLTERCVEWIGERAGADEPFFLFFPWTAPHTPIVPADAYRGATTIGAYGDYVAQCDATAGQVLDALERHGFTDNTIVIFTSDNGPENFAYQRAADSGHRSMGALRGLKRDIWEGGHRVPTIVRWPGVVASGQVGNGLFSQIDIYATLASATDAAIPDGMAEDSLDQIDLLRGGSSARESLVHNTFKDEYAIRRGDWVLIDTNRPGYNRGRVPADYPGPDDYAGLEQPAALFNLNRDLGQRRNVIADHPVLAEELRSLLRSIRGEAAE